MRKTEFVNYHYLVLALLKTYNDAKLLYDAIDYIFENYNFSMSFCNDLYKFIKERSINGD